MEGEQGMNPEDSLRLERWTRGMKELGLTVRAVGNLEWILSGESGQPIAQIKYFPEADFVDRFKIVSTSK